MILKNDNLLNWEFDYRFFTANSTLNKSGELVMGAGIAKQVKLKYPELPAVFGRAIAGKTVYGVLWGDYPFIPFQTKIHWRDKSDLKLIISNLRTLYLKATKELHHTFGLNMPGVGLGEIPLEVIIPYIAYLPNNVTVFTNYGVEK